MRANSPEYLPRLIRLYGTTEDPLLGGYLLPDGRFLDFSEGSGSRIQDHRNITWASLRAEEDRESRYDVLARISKRVGMYRWMPEIWSIESWTPPTPSQLRTIRYLVSLREPILELHRGKLRPGRTGTRFYREYEWYDRGEAIPDLLRFYGVI